MMGSYTWFSYLIFLVFSLFVLLLFLGWSGCCQINMSFIVIFVVSSSCIAVHVSRTCSCDSTVSVHLRHLVSLYFPLKLFLTSSILVLALKMVDASVLFNSFMYFGRSLVFEVCIFSQKLYLRFSSACFLYVMSEVSFQLLWVDIFVFGIVQRFVNMFPHSGCGFFPEILAFL